MGLDTIANLPSGMAARPAPGSSRGGRSARTRRGVTRPQPSSASTDRQLIDVLDGGGDIYRRRGRHQGLRGPESESDPQHHAQCAGGDLALSTEHSAFRQKVEVMQSLPKDLWLERGLTFKVYSVGPWSVLGESGAQGEWQWRHDQWKLAELPLPKELGGE